MPLTALRPTQEMMDIVAALKGSWKGNYAMCHCPAHNDPSPSLSIRQGHKGILVKCFAGCAAEDVLREISRLHLTGTAPIPRYKPYSPVHNANQIWNEGLEIKGTLAERYLVGRNIPIDQPDIRFHPRCPFGRKPKTRFKPALLVAVREGHKIQTIQRIVLDPKTATHKGKFLVGRPMKGAWKVPVPGKVLALAESFEDAAGFTNIHKIPCWASVGNARLPLLRIPTHIEKLILAEDNNTPGQELAAAAMKEYQRPGLVTLPMNPRPYEDWAEANEKGWPAKK